MPEPAFRFRPREPEPEHRDDMEAIPRRIREGARALRQQVNMEGFSGPFTYTRDGETRSREVEGRFFKLTSVDGVFRIHDRSRPGGPYDVEYNVKELLIDFQNFMLYGKLDNGKYVDIPDSQLRFTYILGGRETPVNLSVYEYEGPFRYSLDQNDYPASARREIPCQSWIGIHAVLSDESFQVDGRSQTGYLVIFADMGGGETRSLFRLFGGRYVEANDAPLITVINAEGRKAFNIALGGYP